MSDKVFKYLFIFIILHLFSLNTAAQDSIPESFLEEVVVKAEKNIDVKYFIRQTLSDKTFYLAFKNLRRNNYFSNNDVQFFDKKNNQKAAYKSKTRQTVQNKCRILTESERQVQGDIFNSKQGYNYYTMKMFAEQFFHFDTICNINFNDTSSQYLHKDMNSREAQMRTLIFNPGKKINIPIIGQKMAIFSEAMMPYYNYTITNASYNGVPAYLFAAEIKPEWNYDEYSDRTVIKSFKTYFHKHNKQVLARTYQMKYEHFLFDFDVFMDIELQDNKGKYFPKKIQYKGNWDIPFKKPEIAVFNIQFSQ